MEAAGIVRDPLTAGQAFMNRHQSAGEIVRDYAADIKKLFKESYPEEAQSIAYSIANIFNCPCCAYMPPAFIER